jgi:hypothetical protein
MRHVAYEVICIMRALLGTAATFTNEERFEEEFGPGDEDEELSLPEFYPEFYSTFFSF